MINREKGLSGFLLFPFYLIYRLGVYIKNGLYDFRLLKPYKKIPARVISVGGISFGGSGKSPFTQFLAAKTAQIDPKLSGTAVISRGYKRISRGFLVVSDGKKLQTGVQKAGDELFVLAKKIPKVIVIADEYRIRGMKYAVENFGVRTIILDDAFQKRKIHRDVDVLLLEPDLLVGSKKAFLRESISSLKRADMVVILDAEDKQREIIRERILKIDRTAKFFFGRRIQKGVYILKDDKEIDINNLKGKRICAFCGLAHPDRFLSTLTSQGLEIIQLLSFPDHTWYRQNELTRLVRFFTQNNAEALITTEKDAVKIPPLLYSLPIYYLTIELKIENEKDLLGFVFNL